MPKEALGEGTRLGLAKGDVVLEDPAALLTVPTPQAPQAAGRKPEVPAPEVELGSRVACRALWFRVPERGRRSVSEAIGCGPWCAPSLPLHTPLRRSTTRRGGALSRSASAIGGGGSAARGLASAAGAGQRTHLRGGAAARWVVTRCRLRCQS